MNKKHYYLILIIATCITHSKQIFAEEITAMELDKVTVTASRAAQEAHTTTNSVSVHSEEDMEHYSQRNIRDLVRYEPGVTVTGLGRYGLSGFNIRGIGGDRILTLIDGAPIADEFSFGPNLSSRRNFVDLDALKAVEIVKGPASSLYGSNAIGGLVTFITKDPIDYLNEAQKDYYGSIKSAYDSVNSSFNNTFSYAFGNNTWQGMAIVTHRDGNEYETYYANDDSLGSARKSANPQENTDLNLYTKWVYSPNDSHEYKLIAEKFESDSDTELLTQYNTVVFGTIKESARASDTRDRSRLALQYRWLGESVIANEVHINLYKQSSETAQNTFEKRLTPDQVNQSRSRKSFYEQDNTGIRFNAIKELSGDAMNQQWVYGFDYDDTDASTLRLGQTTVTETGEAVPEFSNFPTRDFPNSSYRTYGLFVQNKLSFLNNRFQLIPSIRYDRFELDPSVDEIYLSGNTGSPTPAAYKESELSSKLGLLYEFNESWRLFAQYAEGFKAPPIDAVNTGFTNFAGGYTTLPNPDLRPESSKTIEAGLRFSGKIHQMEISLYQNRYDDFIEALAFKGFNPATNLLEFQARNLDEAEIDGLEIKGQFNLSTILNGLTLNYAYAQSSGEESASKTPINSIQPESLTAGLRYDSTNERWGVEFMTTLTQRKTDIDDSALQPSDPNAPSVKAFAAPGHAVFDTVGHYRITDKLRLNWGLFNITDKKYWNWNNVLARAEDSNLLPRLTQPGRNASVTLKYEF